MLRWCWLAMLAACRFDLPVAVGGDGPIGPPVPDASPDASSELCFGAFVKVCLAELPGAPLTVNAGVTGTIDTSPGSPDCVTTMPDVGACVVAATSIAVAGTIRGVGPRPLVLLATGSIQIGATGVVDIASRRGGTPGAGANASRCVPGTTPTMQTGGAGGSNAGQGGNGDQAGVGSTGGAASSPLPRPTALFGGCSGIKGAGGGGAGGDTGSGGGAVDLIAPVITIDGTVNASGAGASGASGNSGGGGGGGSGGLIVLDTPELTLDGTGRVLAQGGGGGEGAEGTVAGDNGGDPLLPGQAAQGGSGGSPGGGDGGNGATTGDGGNGGPDGAGSSGGGGGGGGTGFIITTDPTPPAASTSTVCPPLG